MFDWILQLPEVPSFDEDALRTIVAFLLAWHDESDIYGKVIPLKASIDRLLLPGYQFQSKTSERGNALGAILSAGLMKFAKQSNQIH